MNINTVYGKQGMFSENLSRVEKRESVDFENRLEDTKSNRAKKDDDLKQLKIKEDEKKKTSSENKEKGLAKSDEDTTDSNIIVEADGSRVLVVTMKIGGVESTMSIKISDPTDFINNETNDINENVENIKIIENSKISTT